MKVLNRRFSLREKILLLVLIVILMAFGYYRFVDTPIREGIQDAKSQQQYLQTQLNAVNSVVASLENKQSEMDQTTKISIMPSYNNQRGITKLMNDVIGPYGTYTIEFRDVTRDGNQIRREVDIKFETNGDFSVVLDVAEKIKDCGWRCLIDDVKGEVNTKQSNAGTISVNMTVIFYETLTGGEEDTGLPTQQ